MHCSSRILLGIGFSLLVFSSSWCKEQPKSEVRHKVCVAGISNRTATSLMEDRMAARLTRRLVQNKLGAVAMDSPTTNDRELHPTIDNGDEMKRQDCDYLLLIQVRDPKLDPTAPRMPPITIGGRVPSTDASDPMGGNSGSVYHDNLQIDFALFRPGSLKAAMEARILEQTSSNVSDSLVQAMDRVANRVAHDVKKK